MRVLVIHNNELTGALNQSLGVAKSLGANAEITVIPIRLRRMSLRCIARLLKDWNLFRVIGPRGWLSPLWWMLFSAGRRIPRCREPDVIVSHLGSTEYPSVALSEYWNIRNIYIGRPRYHRETDFSMVIRAYEKEKPIEQNVVVLETVPSHILPHEAASCGAQLRSNLRCDHQTPIWCFLVGGSCAGYCYSKKDWDAAVDLIAKCSSELGVSWLISTSRRTGMASEMRLRRHLDKFPGVLLASWHHTGKVVSLAGMVGASDRCIVTEESLSMISDCVSSGCQVFTWGPSDQCTSDVECPNVNRIQGFLQNLEAKERIIRLPDISSPSVEAIKSKSCAPTPSDQRWDVLIKNKAREMGVIKCP